MAPASAVEHLGGNLMRMILSMMLIAAKDHSTVTWCMHCRGCEVRNTAFASFNTMHILYNYRMIPVDDDDCRCHQLEGAVAAGWANRGC